MDGHSYVDFALGDTGAMAGHSPAPVVEAVRRRIETLGGMTAMLPSEDAEWVAAELTRRFGPSRWSFALSATDANRWALRLARLATGRPKILVFSYCYHGSVDETFVVTGPDGTTRSRPGNVAPAVDPATTTVAVEFNDLDAVARALSTGEVAAVLTEPALTNIGIVLPDDGFLAGLRSLCDDTGTLLMVDETHTISAGPGGCTAAWGLDPDVVTLGKAIAGGIPIGAYGLRADLAERVLTRVADGDADLVDVGGIGGTLAGNALSTAAARACLGQVLTDDAYARMDARCALLTERARETLDRHAVPWTVTRLGARSEYRFCSPAPRNGSDSAAAGDPRARRVPAPVDGQPWRAHHPVPQHGPHVPGHHRVRRGSPRRPVRGGRGPSAGLICGRAPPAGVHGDPPARQPEGGTPGDADGGVGPGPPASVGSDTAPTVPWPTRTRSRNPTSSR